MKKILYTCPDCGSDKVLYDAYVMMNDADDVRTFDNKVCDECSASFDIANETEVDVPDDLPIDGAVPDSELTAPGGTFGLQLAHNLVRYFDTWEQIVPKDARAELAPLVQAARLYLQQTRAELPIDVAVPDPEPKVLRGDELLQTMRAMAAFGGGFANHLAAAMSVADSTNAARLQHAFPELIAKYGPGSAFYAATARV